MNLFHAIVLGIIQGLTEFLPVSSSGHLLIFERIFGIKNNIVFDIFLHVGTLLAVLIYYRKEVKYILTHPLSKLAKMLYLSSGVTFVLAILFKKFLLNSFSGDFLAISFIFTAVLLSVATIVTKKTKSKKSLNYFDSVIIGISQAVACIPGISRSGTTLSTSLLLGNERQESLNFSFLLSLPVIMGSLVFSLFEGGGGKINFYLVLIGMVTAFLSGLISIKLLNKATKNNNLIYFSIYLLILGLVLLLVL